MEVLPKEMVIFSHTITPETSEENLQEGIVLQVEHFLRNIFILSANASDSTGVM